MGMITTGHDEIDKTDQSSVQRNTQEFRISRSQRQSHKPQINLQSSSANTNDSTSFEVAVSTIATATETNKVDATYYGAVCSKNDYGSKLVITFARIKNNQ